MFRCGQAVPEHDQGKFISNNSIDLPNTIFMVDSKAFLVRSQPKKTDASSSSCWANNFCAVSCFSLFLETFGVQIRLGQNDATIRASTALLCEKTPCCWWWMLVTYWLTTQEIWLRLCKHGCTDLHNPIGEHCCLSLYLWETPVLCDAIFMIIPDKCPSQTEFLQVLAIVG